MLEVVLSGAGFHDNTCHDKIDGWDAGIEKREARQRDAGRRRLLVVGRNHRRDKETGHLHLQTNRGHRGRAYGPGPAGT